MSEPLILAKGEVRFEIHDEQHKQELLDIVKECLVDVVNHTFRPEHKPKAVVTDVPDRGAGIEAARAAAKVPLHDLIRQFARQNGDWFNLQELYAGLEGRYGAQALVGSIGHLVRSKEFTTSKRNHRTFWKAADKDNKPGIMSAAREALKAFGSSEFKPADFADKLVEMGYRKERTYQAMHSLLQKGECSREGCGKDGIWKAK